MEEIVIETLESLKEYLPQMVRGCQNTAENLQSGNEAVALQIVPDIVEGLEWTLQAISGVKANGQLQDIEISTLTQHFRELVSALEMGDYVLLADLLDYEVGPVLEDWLTNITSIDI
ncbi:hypothetical protein [Neobacillus sp. PS3-40]|uniref:hypothetical protein n=1 Tax=Neobacillus sp. PS3-40 TaxID=3070679 RepID=UPI0027E06193|nr:hypothetical protein [Neobacillus sp. PS3-40]WML46083.1 hypothetical protein RCG20_09425 [Neobacillus sp. PS3-40]